MFWSVLLLFGRLAHHQPPNKLEQVQNLLSALEQSVFIDGLFLTYKLSTNFPSSFYFSWGKNSERERERWMVKKGAITKVLCYVSFLLLPVYLSLSSNVIWVTHIMLCYGTAKWRLWFGLLRWQPPAADVDADRECYFHFCLSLSRILEVLEKMIDDQEVEHGLTVVNWFLV